MPALRKKKPLTDRPAETEYRGKQTRTGNSTGFRFEGALFKSHPEFNGDVKAHVIAPGRMLVTAEIETAEGSDPVMASFLAFVAQDIANNPAKIRPLDERLMKRMVQLTEEIAVDPAEDLGDSAIL